ncbi:cysteinyl leukotriene receptor 1 [Emydura macquarii macquarii]|uniref:cysteinyl leukotriene receptor 1 n=1 Tax=Emydura macquarii macquarii TaxID=1129001 RepID=UPI00352A16AB
MFPGDISQTEPMDSAGNTTAGSMGNWTCLLSIDDFRNKVYSTLYSMIAILGFVGNSFVLCVLIKTYQQKTAFQIYMLNLAVSDLLCVCTLPLRVVYYVHKGNWFFGDFLCRISSYAFYVNLYCSILFMMAMSFSRCIAIVFPVQNLNLVTEKKAKLACVSIWIFVTLTSSPFLLSKSYQDGNKTKCFEPPERDQVTSLLILHYIALFVGFIIPFSVITICYTMIIRTLLKNSLKKNQTTRKKAVWMIIIVTTAFLVSFTPYHIQRTIYLHILNRKDSSCEGLLFMQKSVVITLSLAASNCCFDPLLYFFSGGNFRRRLSTFRKASSSSVIQGPRKKLSLKEKDEELFQESH